MTVIGLDDTDSRERGMCTTYVAHRIAETLERAGHTVERVLLVRLNPAVRYKTRGNAALAIHLADTGSGDGDQVATDPLETTRETVERLAATADDRTNPGVIVADDRPDDVPDAVAKFTRSAIRDHLEIEDAVAVADELGFRHWGVGDGRGRIGALAAIGAWQALADWTYETISYREPDRWGTPREVDHDSVFRAADAGYPIVWDTVDRDEAEAVCVPHTPGPILHGIRGDEPARTREVAAAIEGEPVADRRTFVTNQGTDVHLRAVGALEALDAALVDGRAYRLEGTVLTEPETRRGGHVFVDLGGVTDTDSVGDRGASLQCAAFEPTKRFRDRVRALRPGDRVTACGELGRGTLKLEKFAVRDLVTVERVTPSCPGCGGTMESAGRNQGYRCRDCETSTPEKDSRPLDRGLEVGWYEVPPCARRHIAKPLVRGGFDGPTHPER